MRAAERLRPARLAVFVQGPAGRRRPIPLYAPEAPPPGAQRRGAVRRCRRCALRTAAGAQAAKLASPFGHGSNGVRAKKPEPARRSAGDFDPGCGGLRNKWLIDTTTRTSLCRPRPASARGRANSAVIVGAPWRRRDGALAPAKTMRRRRCSKPIGGASRGGAHAAGSETVDPMALRPKASRSSGRLWLEATAAPRFSCRAPAGWRGSGRSPPRRAGRHRQPAHRTRRLQGYLRVDRLRRAGSSSKAEHRDPRGVAPHG